MPQGPVGPMTPVTNQIAVAFNAGAFHAAIMMALSMPDICAALQDRTGTTGGQKYQAWVERWLLPRYPELTARDVWKLRCGVVHQARFGHDDMQFDRVVFQLPNRMGAVVHRNILANIGGDRRTIYNLSAQVFCNDMIQAVLDWYEAMQADAHVVANLADMVRIHPDGFPPMIVGVPVIA